MCWRFTLTELLLGGIAASWGTAARERKKNEKEIYIMKKSIRSLLAIAVALACLLSVTPLSAFAAGGTVTYYLSNEDTTAYDTQTYNEGEKIVPPTDPSKEGYVFKGWTIGQDGDQLAALPETMGTENITAYATWELKQVTVKYVSDGVEVSSTTAPYGSSMNATIPANPSKEGYSFDGWFDAEGINVHSYTTVPAEDITFTAKWIEKESGKHTVTYVVDGDTVETFSVKEGDPIPKPTDEPKKFGYKFTGWAPEAPEVMGTEDLVFEAQFELDKEFITYVVGGTAIAGAVIAGIAGINTAIITGVAIVGGVSAIIGVSSLVKKTHTVTYKVDGEVYKTYKVLEGKSIPVPEKEPTKDGYDFAGWTPAAPDKMPANDLTFDASWTKKDNNIPDTGSVAAPIGVFAALGAAAALLVLLKKKKENA